MKALIDKTINLLKLRVQMNLDVIKRNQNKIKIIMQEPASSDRSIRLKEETEVNKKLLSENHDFINLQMTLLKFVEKYKNSLSFDEVEVKVTKNETAELDYFQMAVNKKLEYNSNHPLYMDKEFFTSLLEYFQSIEDYESCGKLIRQKPKGF